MYVLAEQVMLSRKKNEWRDEMNNILKFFVVVFVIFGMTNDNLEAMKRKFFPWGRQENTLKIDPGKTAQDIVDAIEGPLDFWFWAMNNDPIKDKSRVDNLAFLADLIVRYQQGEKWPFRQATLLMNAFYLAESGTLLDKDFDLARNVIFRYLDKYPLSKKKAVGVDKEKVWNMCKALADSLARDETVDGKVCRVHHILNETSPCLRRFFSESVRTFVLDKYNASELKKFLETTDASPDELLYEVLLHLN